MAYETEKQQIQEQRQAIQKQEEAFKQAREQVNAFNPLIQQTQAQLYKGGLQSQAKFQAQIQQRTQAKEQALKDIALAEQQFQQQATPIKAQLTGAEQQISQAEQQNQDAELLNLALEEHARSGGGGTYLYGRPDLIPTFEREASKIDKGYALQQERFVRGKLGEYKVDLKPVFSGTQLVGFEGKNTSAFYSLDSLPRERINQLVEAEILSVKPNVLFTETPAQTLPGFSSKSIQSNEPNKVVSAFPSVIRTGDINKIASEQYGMGNVDVKGFATTGSPEQRIFLSPSASDTTLFHEESHFSYPPSILDTISKNQFDKVSGEGLKALQKKYGDYDKYPASYDTPTKWASESLALAGAKLKAAGTSYIKLQKAERELRRDMPETLKLIKSKEYEKYVSLNPTVDFNVQSNPRIIPTNLPEYAIASSNPILLPRGGTTQSPYIPTVTSTGNIAPGSLVSVTPNIAYATLARTTPEYQPLGEQIRVMLGAPLNYVQTGIEKGLTFLNVPQVVIPEQLKTIYPRQTVITGESISGTKFTVPEFTRKELASNILMGVAATTPFAYPATAPIVDVIFSTAGASQALNPQLSTGERLLGAGMALAPAAPLASRALATKYSIEEVEFLAKKPKMTVAIKEPGATLTSGETAMTSFEMAGRGVPTNEWEVVGRGLRVEKETPFQRAFNKINEFADLRATPKTPTKVLEFNPFKNPQGYKETIGVLEQSGFTTAQAKAYARYSAPQISDLALKGTVTKFEGIPQLGEYNILLSGKIKETPSVFEFEPGLKTRSFEPRQYEVTQWAKSLGENKKGILEFESYPQVEMSYLSEGKYPYQRLSQQGRTTAVFEQKSAAKLVGGIEFPEGKAIEFYRERALTKSLIPKRLKVTPTESSLFVFKTGKEPFRLDIPEGINIEKLPPRPVRKVDDVLLGYHGTTDKYINDILTGGGLKPAKTTGIYQGKAVPPEYVSASTSKDFAESFARRAAVYKGGKPVVLEIRIPKSEVGKYKIASEKVSGIGGEIRFSEVPAKYIKVPQIETIPKPQILELPKPKSAPKVNLFTVRKSLPVTTIPKVEESAFYGKGLYERTEEVGYGLTKGTRATLRTETKTQAPQLLPSVKSRVFETGASVTRTQTVQVEKLRPMERIMLGVTPIELGLTNQAQRLTPTERTAERLAQRVTQKEAVAQRTTPTQIFGGRTTPPPPTPPRTPPPRIRYKFPKETKPKITSKAKKVSPFGFTPELRRYGKFTAIGKPTTLERAIGIGKAAARTTLGASLRVKSPTGYVSFAPSEEFRLGKRSPTILVQRKTTRLSSPFEVKEILSSRKGGFQLFK